MIDDEITQRQIPAFNEALAILVDAESKLGQLGDQLHELRRQVEKIRRRVEAQIENANGEQGADE